MLQKLELNQAIFETCYAKGSPTIDIARLKNLLEQGADPNFAVQCDLFPHASANKEFTFPLLHIISRKQNAVEAAKILIQYGANIHQVDSCIGNTPLLTAIARRDEDLALFFITQCKESHDPILKTIIDQKDSGRECQNTPLVLALKKRMPAVALQLIEAGAHPDMTCRNGETALHWACVWRETGVIHALIAKNVNAAITNKFGRTAYEYYVYPFRLIDVANPFDEKGSRKVCTANLRELSDLYFHIAESYRDYFYSELKRLVEYRNGILIEPNIAENIKAVGVAVQSLDEQHTAIVKEQTDSLKKEAEKLSDAFFPLRGGQGLADFLQAVVNEIYEEKKQARFANAELNLAVKERDKAKIETLLASATQETVNACCTDGFTALHWAAMVRDDELIGQLMKLGAVPTLKNKYGRTAIDYYSYQIRRADFREMMDKESYEGLIHDTRFDAGEAKMPEFNEVFSHYSAIVMGAPKRNQKPMNPQIFGANFPLPSTIEEKKNVIRAPEPVNRAFNTCRMPNSCRTVINSYLDSLKESSFHPVLSQPTSFASPKTNELSQTSILSSGTTFSARNQDKTSLHPDLQRALYDGGVERNYVKPNIIPLSKLIEIHNNTPWVIGALCCFNIREGITKNYITIDQFTLLTEEQVHSVEHKYQGERLTAKVQEFMVQNKDSTLQISLT